MNELMWILTLLFSFFGVLLFYKLFGKVGLFVWIATATIICNIQTTKIIDIFGLETSLGTILYGSTFLATDIINERYGKKQAKKTIGLGFLVMLFMTILMTIALLYIPSKSDFANESLKIIFTLNIRITFGSICGFGLSQLVDTVLYNKFKIKFKGLWIRNNISTIISQLIDTIVFVSITYLGNMPISIIFNIACTMYIFKVLVAILDTPFMYLSQKIKCNEI